jgi:hypothetical protein
VIERRSSVGQSLANDIVNQIEQLLLEADRAHAAVEVDPYRGRLFELFVMADAAGFLADDSDHDLSCDAVGRELAQRWELGRGVGPKFTQPSQLPPAQLAKMRLLWSFMRLWMEWSYAWQRWEEFHPSPESAHRDDDDHRLNGAVDDDDIDDDDIDIDDDDDDDIDDDDIDDIDDDDDDGDDDDETED